jgi:hypothetical protein
MVFCGFSCFSSSSTVLTKWDSNLFDFENNLWFLVMSLILFIVVRAVEQAYLICVTIISGCFVPFIIYSSVSYVVDYYIWFQKSVVAFSILSIVIWVIK